MNRDEAFRILGLAKTASEDEINKRFKKLAAKAHPDQNKAPDAQEKFSQLNEAWRLAKSKEQKTWSFPTSPKPKRRKIFQSPPVFITIPLSFEESMKGCEKEIKFSRFECCSVCDGSGGETGSNICNTCKGQGTRAETSVSGNSTFTTITECPTCQGLGVDFNKCDSCEGSAVKSVDKALKVNIPGGIVHQMAIRLAGQGSWLCNPFQAGYTDVIIRASVTPHKELSFDGKDITSQVDISLLMALKGGTKKITTLDGETDIKINPKSRHRDDVRLGGKGAVTSSGTTDHVVTLNVVYPENVEDLLKYLEGN